MGPEDPVRINFGDGVSALDRVLRFSVQIVDAAVNRLTDLGYDRQTEVRIRPSEDGLPIYVDLIDRVAFILDCKVIGGDLSLKGEWQFEVKPKKKPGFWARLFRRK